MDERKSNIKMLPVKSSNISAVGYDNESSKLRVVFINGGTYSYANVPKDIYESMVAGDSAGKYFYKNVRNNFKFTKE